MIVSDHLPRRIGWFSCGAASAVTMMLSKPEIIAYCETGSEHQDNRRFLADCEKWFERKVTRLKNEKYSNTWEVWEDRQYLAGVKGAPCTKELKVKPRLAFQHPDDVHIFGYTSDQNDIRRAANLREHYPELNCEFPLIDQGISKAACLAMIERAGIRPPLTYALGMPNANCIPCVKATSPAYWALIRKEFPSQFEKMVELSRRLDVKLTRLNGQRSYIDEIPPEFPTTEPIAPECDFLCSLAEEEF